MKFVKLHWDYDSDPSCKNGDIIVLVQFGEAQIAKYTTPKPKDAPKGRGNFIFEMCDNENLLEEEVYEAIRALYPEVAEQQDNPVLFSCPPEFASRAIW